MKLTTLLILLADLSGFKFVEVQFDLLVLLYCTSLVFLFLSLSLREAAKTTMWEEVSQAPNHCKLQ